MHFNKKKIKILFNIIIQDTFYGLTRKNINTKVLLINIYNLYLT